MTQHSFIWFRKRHTPVDFAIPEFDLVEIAKNEKLQISRATEKELPKEVVVIYMDYDLDYAQGAQYTRRVFGTAEGNTQVEMPIVTDKDHAKLVSQVALYQAWLGRQKYKFATTQKWAHLEPTDCGTLTCDGVLHSLLIINKIEKPSGEIIFEATAEDATMYEASEPAVPMPDAPGQSLRRPLNCKIKMLDIVWWRNNGADGLGGFYAFAEPEVPSLGFNGAEFYYSADSGNTWLPLGFQQANRPAIYGNTITVLASADNYGIPDEENSVTVLLIRGTIEDSDWDGLLERDMLALIGDEIVALRDVVDLGGGKYELSGMQRGLFGTEWAGATHDYNDRFVLLNNAIQFFQIPTQYIDTPLMYSCVSLGTGENKSRESTLTWSGEMFKPRSPIEIGGGRQSNGDVVFRWTPRTRYPNTLIDYNEMSLAEDEAPAFEVDVYDSTFTTLVRTLFTTTNSVTYTAVEQTSDFGSPTPTSFGLRVYQQSSLLAGSPSPRGHAGEAIVTA